MGRRFARRSFLTGAGVTGAASVLAACGVTPTPQVIKEVVTQVVEKEVTKEVEKVVTTEVEKVVKETVVVEQAPAPAEPVDLVFWNYWPDAEPVFLAMLDMFQDRYPEVTVKYELLPWDQYWQKLNATLVTGNPPDVWYTAPTFYYEYVDRNQLVDLQPFIDVDQDIKPDDWFPKAYDCWKAGPSKTVFGLPSDMTPQIMFYNKDLFDQAGVGYPTEEWTWDDFLVAAKTLTNHTGSPETEIWGAGSVPSGWDIDAIIESNGGLVIDAEQTRCLMTESPEAIETVQFMVDCIYKHQVAPPAGQFEGMGDPFLTGKVAMQFNITIGQGEYKTAPFSWDNQLIPRGTAKRANRGEPDGFVASAPTKHPKESYNLIKFLTSQAGPIFYIGTGLVPVRKDIANSPAFLQQPPPPEHYDVWFKAVEYTSYYFGRGYNEWQTAKANALQAAYLGQQPVEEAVRTACEGIDAVFAKVAAERATAG